MDFPSEAMETSLERAAAVEGGNARDRVDRGRGDDRGRRGRDDADFTGRRFDARLAGGAGGGQLLGRSRDGLAGLRGQNRAAVDNRTAVDNRAAGIASGFAAAATAEVRTNPVQQAGTSAAAVATGRLTRGLAGRLARRLANRLTDGLAGRLARRLAAIVAMEQTKAARAAGRRTRGCTGRRTCGSTRRRTTHFAGRGATIASTMKQPTKPIQQARFFTTRGFAGRCGCAAATRTPTISMGGAIEPGRGKQQEDSFLHEDSSEKV